MDRRRDKHCRIDLLQHPAVINDYEAVASVYDDAFGNDYWNSVWGVLLKAIRQFFRGLPPERCLDLACGTGTFLSKLAEEFRAECQGIDLSEQQISIAKTKLAGFGTSVSLHVGDVRIVQFPQMCDLVSMNLDALNHLCHPGDWLRLFRKVYRSLNQTGLFLFDVNTPSRLLEDWSYPEVIIGPDVTYIQCGLKPEIRNGYVRREIIMVIYSHRNGTASRHIARVKQLALPTSEISRMLGKAGFTGIREIDVPQSVRSRHMFLRNRLFYSACKRPSGNLSRIGIHR